MTRFDRARHLLQDNGIETEFKITEGPGHATELAKVALTGGADLVIVRGGDGTLNETLQAMVGSDVPLAIWPGGTANVLADVLGIPRAFEQVMQVIVHGHPRPVTVGQANTRYFFLMAGIGLDASIISHIKPGLKQIGGVLAFWESGLRHLAIWKAPVFTLTVNGDILQATFAALANAPKYGGGLRLTPKAALDTDWLDVCAVTSRSVLRYLMVHLPGGFTGHHIGQKGVYYFRAMEAHAESLEEVWVQVDGELLGPLPVTFRSIPRGVRVIVPPKTALA